MGKFILKHKSKIVTACLSLALISVLDWDWSHFKSFATGGLIALTVGVEILKVTDNA